MSYPTSSDVAPGDITAASQYNNLRADALRFGQAAADAVNVGTMLELYESNLKIIRLNTTQLRIEASLTSPVSLNVYGYPVRTTANVDLAVGDAPSGPAATYYIFANRSDSSTSFTLSVSTSATEAANQRRIGRFYWDGTEIVRESIRTEFSSHVKTLINFTESMHQCGRLTLATNDPVTNSDVPTSSMVYFTPYLGNRISLYVPGYGWRVHTFSELSLDISGYTGGKNYDIFLYDNAGILTLEGVAWSNDTLRSVSLSTQDGRRVKNGYPNKLYLGTIRCHTFGASCDTLLARFVWNQYNRTPRLFQVNDSTNNWTYNSSTWRQWNANSANKVEFVVGYPEDPVYMQCISAAYYTGASYAAIVGLGFDTISGNNAIIWASNLNASGAFINPQAVYFSMVSLGYHYISLQERSASGSLAVTFYGSNTYSRTGGFGWIYA